jgi:hypothetical protein
LGGPIRVDIKKKKVEQRISLPFVPHLVVPDRRSRCLWTLNGNQLVAVMDSGREIYSTGFTVFDMAYDRSRSRLLAIDMRGNLWDIESTKVLRYGKEIAAMEDPKYAQQRKKLIEEMHKATEHQQLPLAGGSRTPQLLVDADNKRLYFDRGLFEMKNLKELKGRFKTNPYAQAQSPELRQFLARFPELDQIMAASPDGKWAANGTHIFSAVDFTVHAALPVPTGALAFSKESNELYIFDFVNSQLAAIRVVPE